VKASFRCSTSTERGDLPENLDARRDHQTLGRKVKKMRSQNAQIEAASRWVTIVTAGALVAIGAFGGAYIRPYFSGLGPVFLLCLLGAYVATVGWMRSLVQEARGSADSAKVDLVAEQLAVPVFTLGMIFMALLCCPAVLRLMG
jgi:hypothetical protein